MIKCTFRVMSVLCIRMDSDICISIQTSNWMNFSALFLTFRIGYDVCNFCRQDNRPTNSRPEEAESAGPEEDPE